MGHSVHNKQRAGTQLSAKPQTESNRQPVEGSLSYDSDALKPRPLNVILTV
jgi:hypothetical protein